MLFSNLSPHPQRILENSKETLEEEEKVESNNWKNCLIVRHDF